MATVNWTKETVARAGATEVVTLTTTEGYNHQTTDAIVGFVHAHDPHGRPIYDEQGRPILVPWQRQKPHTTSTAIGVWVLVVLQAIAVIAGIVAAYNLNDLVGPGF